MAPLFVFSDKVFLSEGEEMDDVMMRLLLPHLVGGCTKTFSSPPGLRFSAQISGFCFLKAQPVISTCGHQPLEGGVPLPLKDDAHIYTQKREGRSFIIVSNSTTHVYPKCESALNMFTLFPPLRKKKSPLMIPSPTPFIT